MADGGLLLSPRAKAQIDRLVRDTSDLRRRLSSIEGKYPLGRKNRVFAEVTGQDSTDKWRYNATQKIWNDVAETWDIVTGGITFGDGADDVGWLIHLDLFEGVETGSIVEAVELGDVDGTTQWFTGYAASELNHPFKGSVDTTNIKVGLNRTSNIFEDWIQLRDTDGKIDVIEKAATETIAISSGTRAVYYIISQDPAGAWTATLTESDAATWPPDDTRSNIYWRIGTAVRAGAVVTWGQEQFSNPYLWLRAVEASFTPTYVNNSATPSVLISAGRVGSYKVSGNTNAVTLSLAAALHIWVEVTNAPGSTAATVDPDLKSNAVLPAYAVEAAGAITLSIPVGEITSGGVYLIKQLGNIDLASTIHQPDFHADVRGANGEQSVRLLGIKTLASKGDVSKTLLLQARTTDIDVLGGNVEDQTDVAEIKLYGVDDDVSMDHVEDWDTSTDDEFTATRNTYTDDEDAGLTQANEVAAATARTILFDGIWIKQVGAQIFHDKTTQGGSEDWTSIDHSTFTGIAYYDNNGHLQKKDSTGSPGPTKLWKYRECGGTAIIYRNADDGAFIEVNSTCYERLGEVATAVAANTDTDTGYGSCALCIAAVVNEEWLKCSDDSAAVVYEPADDNLPTGDYAWILIGGVYIKCYMNALVGTAAGADPCSISTNGAAPTACADVVLDYFTDSFPGSSRRACYWPTTGGTYTISADTVGSGNWTLTGYSGGGSLSKSYEQDDFSRTGTFSEEIAYASRTFANTGGQYVWHGLYVYTGATLFRVLLQKNAGSGREAESTLAGEGTSDHTSTDPWSGGVKSLKITRQGDNKIRVYIGGVLRRTTSGTYTGAATIFRVYIGGINAVGDPLTVVSSARNMSETP